MKTKGNLARHLLVTSSMFFFSVLVFTACHKDNNSKNNTNKTYTISGNASGSQVVPAVADSGTATIAGTYNSSTGQLITTTTWTNLTGGPTLGGFYTGASGTNGALIGSSWALGSGLTATGSFADTMTLTADQATQLTTGNWYFLLGTAANPNGEVRGQITATAQ
jgi:hypothetical protein